MVRRCTIEARVGAVVAALAVSLTAQTGWSQDDDFYDDEFYEELDAFALAHLNGMQPRSFAENVEFCGYYGLDADLQIIASGPDRGDSDGCLPADPPPQMVEWLASWHTHGAYSFDADSEVPSLDDLLGDIADGVDGYIATPGGRVWLNLYQERQSELLCGPGCIAADPNFQECRGHMPGESYTVQSLQARFDNDPGTC